jgi:hypothetical protein
MKMDTELHLNSITEILFDNKFGQRWAFRAELAKISVPYE